MIYFVFSFYWPWEKVLLELLLFPPTPKSSSKAPGLGRSPKLPGGTALFAPMAAKIAWAPKKGGCPKPGPGPKIGPKKFPGGGGGTVGGLTSLCPRSNPVETWGIRGNCNLGAACAWALRIIDNSSAALSAARVLRILLMEDTLGACSQTAKSS